MKGVTKRKERPKGHKWCTSDKIDALVHLHATLHRHGDREVPTYEEVYNRLGIPVRTLTRWWKNRVSILKHAGTTVATLSEVQKVAVAGNLKAIDAEFRSRDLSRFTPGELLAWRKEYNTVYRLLMGYKPGETGKGGKIEGYRPIFPGAEEIFVDQKPQTLLDHNITEIEDQVKIGSSDTE